jgi:acetolactate synthase-1/2/3 large subunit
MNGAERIIQTAVANGIEICFANPGTTELPLVCALDSISGIRAVLGPFEGCCTGAADGYGRMADKPALTLLHLGPGLANGIANLHNARRAKTPLVNLIGEHATGHRPLDPPLTMDIQALAATVSGWQKTINDGARLSADMAEAIAAAMMGQVATLIVPHDQQWAPAPEKGTIKATVADKVPDSAAVQKAARLLHGSNRCALILGGRALRRQGLQAAAAIQKASGCDLLSETFPARIERGQGLPDPARIAYFPESGIQMLASYDTLILAGAKEPVAFFGYPDTPGRFLTQGQTCFDLCPEVLRADLALVHLADELRGSKPMPKTAHGIANASKPLLPTGRLTAQAACNTLAALQPENAIVVEEAVTSGSAYYPLTAGAPAHSLLMLTGGSLGQGMPCAVGAALACPDRPVINFQADGSALYTVQSLWMQAREGLNITTLICANRSYDILKIELARAGHKTFGPAAFHLTDLNRPAVDWESLSRGLGVPAKAVETAEAMAGELQKALAEPGPHLIVLDLAY